MHKKTAIRMGLSAMVFLAAGCGGYASSPYPQKETRIKGSEARYLNRSGPPTAEEADRYKLRLGERKDGRQIRIWYYKQQRFPNERYLIMIVGSGVRLRLACLVDSGTDEHRLVARLFVSSVLLLTQDMQYALVAGHSLDKRLSGYRMWLVRLADRRAVHVLSTNRDYNIYPRSIDERRLVCIIGRQQGHSLSYHRPYHYRRYEVDLTQAYADLDGPKAADIQNVFGGEWHAPPFPVIEAPAPPETPETPEATAAP